MKSYQEFFAELKRRKVFKVAAVYGVVAFGLIQVADPLTGALLLPDTFLTYVVAVLLLGFPLALVLAWAFEVNPDGVQRTGAAAPGEIEAIVSAPASQRWPAGVMALVGAAALLAGGWWVGQRTSSDSADTPALASASEGARLAYLDLADDPRPSIAVLPFADMSSSQDQEYFGDGMAEEILNTLVGIKDLRVAGRTSAFAYKGENKDLREIGAELGVAYLVEGSVRKEGDQLRITAQLIDASDGSHLWSDRYDRPLTNVFQIQSEIAEAIAGALTVPLGLDGASGLVTPTGDLEAYDLYLAGRARLRERDEGVFEAVDLFKAAVALDSTWAPAWAGLADAISLQVWYEGLLDEPLPFEETLAEAEQAALRALELNSRNSTALIALGSIHRDSRRWDEAEDLFQQALDLDPDNAEAHQQYGEWLHKTGRVAAAVRSMDRASALDPAPVRVWQLIVTLRTDDRWDEIEEVLEWAEAEGLHERFVALGGAMRNWPRNRARQEGRYEDAWLRDSVESPADTSGIGEQIRALRAGRFDMLPDSMQDSGLRPDLLIQLNEPDLAVESLLQRMRDFRLSPDIVWSPDVDEIRSDPRVQAYMDSIGLGGRTLQRTPVDERVRPAILRQADAAAAAAAAAEKSAP
jgi:TolB-like protein